MRLLPINGQSFNLNRSKNNTSRPNLYKNLQMGDTVSFGNGLNQLKNECEKFYAGMQLFKKFNYSNEDLLKYINEFYKDEVIKFISTQAKKKAHKLTHIIGNGISALSGKYNDKAGVVNHDVIAKEALEAVQTAIKENCNASFELECLKPVK